MAKFVTTGAIVGEIEDIIKNAKQEIVLVSPYLSVQQQVFERLEYASRMGIAIVLIYRKNADRNKADLAGLKKLEQLNTLALYTIDNLHAKCFLNESKLLITSMNLHQYSESHNREMGIAATKAGDRQIYNEAYTEYESIKAGAEPVNELARKNQTKPEAEVKKLIASVASTPEKGVCIRCETPIPFSVFAPYCHSCYGSWAAWSNADFLEKYCHMCSKPEQTSMNKPLCYTCFTEHKAMLPHVSHG